MKFTGLILICASSCLALLLPAIGVVKFPKVSAATASYLTPDGVPVSNTTANSMNNPWQPASQQNNAPLPTQIAGNTNPLFPGATGLPGATGGSASPDPFPPSSQNNATTQFPGSTNPDPASNKLGLGIWLLLGPVCLIGLAMWSLAPNPSGSK